MNPVRVVIKKYGNRRLYDTSSSRYVNLEDIAGMIRAGADVQVVDAKAGEDLTRVTLTQIIVEDSRERPGLPLELLRQLIVTSDHVGRDFIMWYLKSAMDAYQKVQSAVQSGITEVRSAALSPLDTMRTFLQQSMAPHTAGAQNDSELEELRKRIAELERQQKPRRQTRRKNQR